MKYEDSNLLIDVVPAKLPVYNSQFLESRTETQILIATKHKLKKNSRTFEVLKTIILTKYIRSKTSRINKKL
jgi:hypothetical protein